MIMIDREEAAQKHIKLIPFPNVEKQYRPMFYVQDGKQLELTLSDGEKIVRPCIYLDPHHFRFGSSCYHIDQFAEMNQRNGNTCRPLEQVTDLDVFRKHYADRELKGEDGKTIPYRAILGWDPDHYGQPKTLLCICPEAEPDRQVAYIHTTVGEKTFYSVPEAWSTLLPIALPETRHELFLVSAIFERYNPLVEHISQKDWDAIPTDYKGIYSDYTGYHPDWNGRKTAFLPGHGTQLFIEGVSFVIDQEKSLDQLISKAEKQSPGIKSQPLRKPSPER